MRLRQWVLGQEGTSIRFLEPTVPQRQLREEEGLGRGLVSSCYANVWQKMTEEYALNSTELSYVDGWCVLWPLSSLPHCWMVDRTDGCLIEATFLPEQVAAGSVYVGFVLPREQHLARVKFEIALAAGRADKECHILTSEEQARARARCVRVARSIR